MAKKKPKEKEELEKAPILVEDLKTLRLFLDEHKLNPMEKMMAVRLLINGYKFYCQYKIEAPDGWTIGGRKYFVADFYIPGINTVIETDGKIHETEVNKIKDRSKDNTLASMGYYVFRFVWDDVMETEADDRISVLDFIDALWELKSIEKDVLEMEVFKRVEEKKKELGIT